MGISTSAKIVVGYTYDEIYTAYENGKKQLMQGIVIFTNGKRIMI